MAYFSVKGSQSSCCFNEFIISPFLSVFVCVCVCLSPAENDSQLQSRISHRCEEIKGRQRRERSVSAAGCCQEPRCVSGKRFGNLNSDKCSRWELWNYWSPWRCEPLMQWVAFSFFFFSFFFFLFFDLALSCKSGGLKQASFPPAERAHTAVVTCGSLV